MQDEINELKNRWNQGKADPPEPMNLDSLEKSAAKKKRASILAQWSTIVILSLTFTMIYLLLVIRYPYSTMLARTGVALMLGGLGIRILIELYSIWKVRGIQTWKTTDDNTESTIQYRRFRKMVHGPVTIAIVVFYIAGFYLLMPEFSKHAPRWLTILFCISIPPGAFIMITQIRKGIKKEMKDLQDWIDLKSMLHS